MTVPGNLSSPLLATAADAAAAVAGPIKSLRFNSGDSANLHRTPSSAGNRKTWTFAAWIKLSAITTSDLMVFSSRVSGTAQIQIGISGAPRIGFSEYGIFDLRTDRLIRDPGAWFHLCCVFDSSNSTEGNRARVYVNGVRETDFSTETYPSQNAEASWNRTERHNIGSLQPSYSNYFDGYMADIYFIDGSAIDPVDNFIEADSNGVYQAKEYTGTYGTNGFHLLDFANESTIGHDSSGNENDFTAVNFSTTAGTGNDVLFDVPTNGTQSDTGAGGEVSGCYATLNPLDAATASSLSNGNLDQNGGNNVRATIGAIGSGKWYWEFTKTSDRDTGASNVGHVGLLPGDTSITALSTYAHYRDDGKLQENGSTIATYSTWTNGDVIGIAMNNDDEEYSMYKNGTLIVTRSYPANITAENVFPYVRNNTGQTGSANFGQRAFAYSAPSGFSPICTALLPTPTIADGSDYFDTVTYTGNGTTAHSITGLSLASAPDLVWIKQRNATRDHVLQDVIRGTGVFLSTNTTAADQSNGGTGSSSLGIQSFDSNGFTLGTGTGVNTSSGSYVAWAWEAGSSTASNTDGSVTSSVRANQTAGFSIVSYTADGTVSTIGHGLNAAPQLIIGKSRDGAYNWMVGHEVLGFTKFVNLNSTSAAITSSDAFNNTAPTSSVFTIGSNNNQLNRNGDDYIAYCFAPVAGFSSFGSYEGNGSSDGAFVYTGFRPAWILVKNADGTGHWVIMDSKRDVDNQMEDRLKADASDAESNTPAWDALSNGFKIRSTYGFSNSNGNTYIYAAFSENAFSLNGGLAR